MANFDEHQDKSLLNNSSYVDNLDTFVVSGSRSANETFDADQNSLVSSVFSTETGENRQNVLQLTRLNADLKEANDEKARLSHELTDQKQEVRQLKETNRNLTEQLIELQKNYVQSNNRLYQQLTTPMTPKRTDGKQMEELTSQLNEANERIRSLESQKEERVKKLEGALTETEIKLKLELQKGKFYEEKQSKLKNELQSLKNELQSLKNEREQTKDMHEKAMNKLQAELKKMENECKNGKLMAKIDEKEKNHPVSKARSETLNKNKKQKKAELDSNDKLVSPTSIHVTRKRTSLIDTMQFDGALSSSKRIRDEVSAEPSLIAESAKIMPKIYAFSLTNSQQWARFDCDTDKWIGLLNGSFGVEKRSYFDVATIGRKIFIIGGKIDRKTSSANCYAKEPDSTSSLFNTPIVKEFETPRQKHSSVTIEDEIYVFGGQCKYSCNNDTPVECYSSELSAWTTKGKSNSRHSTASAVLDRVAYVFGGHNNHKKLNMVERFDPRQPNAELLTNMNWHRVGASAVEHNGRIFVTGGSNEEYLNTTEIFEPRTNSWVNGPVMNTPRAWHGLFSDGTRLLAIGGKFNKFPLNSMEVLVPSGVDDKWNEHVEVLPFAGGIRIAAI